MFNVFDQFVLTQNGSEFWICSLTTKLDGGYFFDVPVKLMWNFDICIDIGFNTPTIFSGHCPIAKSNKLYL